MRSDVERYYREAVEKRHNGIDPGPPPQEPFTKGFCESCGRKCVLSKDLLCVSCIHAGWLAWRDEKRRENAVHNA